MAFHAKARWATFGFQDSYSYSYCESRFADCTVLPVLPACAKITLKNQDISLSSMTRAMHETGGSLSALVPVMVIS